MKPSPFTDMCGVITADQVGSRVDTDRVPAALDALTGFTTSDGLVRPFERTAGDEIQGIVADGASAVRVLRILLRSDHWRAGVGVGRHDSPLPGSTRAGRGPVFIAAREAVQAAHRGPQGVAVRAGRDMGAPPCVGADAYGADQAAHDAQSCLWLLADLWRRRSPEGWEVVDLMDTGTTGRQVAERLGISASAVSQRAAAARYAEGRHGEILAARLLDGVMTAMHIDDTGAERADEKRRDR